MEPMNKTPFYQHNAMYAREHGELDQYRASHWTNMACSDDIEHAISRNFDGMHLKSEAATEILDKYGAERVQFVLAATVRTKAWDGRFSASNKAWAFAANIPDVSNSRDDRLNEYAVNSHPAVLDGFISRTRKEIAEQEKPSIKETLHQTAAPKTKNAIKKDTMER